MSVEAYADLLDAITICEFSVKGMVYVTTLLEAKKYPKTAIASFYQQRWHIEVDIKAIKTHMGMELLSKFSANPSNPPKHLSKK